MATLRDQVWARYIENKNTDADILVTPEAARLLRGLMRMTPKRLSSATSVKKNQLERFEKGNRHLSPRDRLWLQSAFEVAGAEFFTGQGQLFVTFSGRTIIAYGEKSEMFENLPIGDSCREARYDRYWSQLSASRHSGVPQHIISAIENRRPKKYYIADQLALKRTFDRYPV